MAPLSEKEDPRDRIITLNDVPVAIEQTKGKTWRIKKPLVDGKKTIAGSTHMGVKPKDSTWKNFKNTPSLKYRFDIGKPDDTGESLNKLLKRIVELKIEGFDNQDFVRERLFKKADSVTKYLKVADWVGLWDYDKKQAAKKATESRGHLQKGVVEPLGAKKDKRFFEDPLIEHWLKKFTDNDAPEYHRYMFNALKILNMTPDDLAYTDYKGDPNRKQEAIEERIFPLRAWAENPYNYNPATSKNRKPNRNLLPENRFVKGTIIKYVKPDEITRLPSDINWEKLIEKTGDHKGKIAVGDRNNNVMYNYAKVIRNFINANVGHVSDVPETHILSQEAPSVAQYGSVKLSWNQIEGMRKCLRDGIKNNTKKVKLHRTGKTFRPIGKTKRGWTKDGDGTYDLEWASDKWSVKSYWEDAYFFFMLGVEMGFRAEEGFDIITEEPADIEQDSGVRIEFDGDQKLYFVYLYTRKTEKQKEGRIHEGFIPNSADGDIVKKLIDKRLAEVAKNQGVDPNSKHHSLIGADNKYTKISTITLSTDQVVPYDNRRRILKNIFRHCYQEVEAASSFYYERPVHAIRHVFAQYWLNKSGYNYTFVMKLGHWQTLSTLMKSYGKMDPKVFALDHNLFANIDASKPYSQRMKDIANAKAKQNIEEPKDYVPTGKPKKPKDVIIQHLDKAHLDVDVVPESTVETPKPEDVPLAT